MGHPDAGFSMESDETLTDYFTGNLSEFKNNLVQSDANPYKSSNNAIATAAQIKTKAEADGCITYTLATDIQLESPFYSTNPNFLPKAGSPALTGADFTGTTGFTATTYRGAFGATNWTTGWTNWDPQNNTY
jgi:hypothetical protein